MQKIIIPVNEVKYLSLVDKFGKVFKWNNRIFRAIYNDKESDCLKLFNSGLFDELINRKLIPYTEISEYKIEGFNLVLEHKKITNSEPCDWSFDMLKDAALMMIELNELCNKYSYKLYDGHPWNILFDKNKPLFVDLGSIVSIDTSSQCFEIEMKKLLVYPLILMSEGEFYLARKLIENGIFNMHTIPVQDLCQSILIGKMLKDFCYKIYKKIKHEIPFNKKIKFFRKRAIHNFMDEYFKDNVLTKKFIDKHINYYQNLETMWSQYQENSLDIVREGRLEGFKRFEKIADLIKSFKDCNSMIDLAGNQGVFSLYISKVCPEISKITNTDYDETAINKSYKEFKKNNDPIETYLMNFIMPANKFASEYFKADIAVALAVTHHLILSQGYDVNFIFEKIKSYANKYVIIEFMHMGLWNGKEAPPIPEWYSTNWFKENFKKHFELLHEEILEENRIVFVGMIKDVY